MISIEMTEPELLARAQGGDQDAFAELVRQHAPLARRTALVMGAASDADDVVQESFVLAYRNLGRFRAGAAFRPWLLQIVTNQAHNLHRSGVRRRNRESTVWTLEARTLTADDPLDAALSTERATQLLEAMATLAERYRQVVACRYLLDLDERETAQVLAIPRGTVKSRTNRALAQLRSELEASDREARHVSQ